ncbi:hypothetical protein VTI74DRAFT_10661 [Chaetomium olivicolor]
MSTTSQAEPAPTFFINLPTTSLSEAAEFFTSLNFTRVEAWSDASTTTLLLPAPNSTICLMLHAHSRFRQFMRPGSSIANPHTSTEVLFSIRCETREEVDGWLDRVEKAGGKRDPYVMDKYGEGMGMYVRSWADGEGHVWECFCMLPGGGCSGGEKREGEGA